MTVPELTPQQIDALRVLADGEEHDTWKQRSDRERGRVNFLAAESLRKLDLATIRYRYGSSTIKITNAGRAVLDLLDARSEIEDCSCHDQLIDRVRRTVGHPYTSCPYYGTTTPLDDESKEDDEHAGTDPR